MTRKPNGKGASRVARRVQLTQALRGLGRNLAAGLRAAFFLRVDPTSWAASPGQLIAIVLIAVALGVALSRTFYSGPVFFNWDGTRALWLEVPLFLWVGWLTSRFAARRIGVLTIPIALFAVTVTTYVVVTAALHLMMQSLPPRVAYSGWAWLYRGYGVWFILIAALLVYRTGRLTVPHALLAVLPLAALAAFDVVSPRAPLWYQMPDDEERWSSRASPAAEEMLYLQPRLAEQSVNALASHRKGVPEFYFVGFAPSGYQNVFMKESEVIRTLMDERFDTRGRSLLLVNNNKTLRQYPLATVTNLRAALRRIGRLIDKEEDVVVLYLTSHGSKQHRLSADYWPLQLQEVEPGLLKQLLDEAGIKWRVIVVSACYSGGFIEPLRGPATLVMTAADATHTSFGCGNSADFTYFAKALFDEQLRATYSFEDAFERALPVIREREQQVREEFSNPQIAAGGAIRAKLAQIERRLAARPVNGRGP